MALLTEENFTGLTLFFFIIIFTVNLNINTALSWQLHSVSTKFQVTYLIYVEPSC